MKQLLNMQETEVATMPKRCYNIMKTATETCRELKLQQHGNAIAPS
jgi:hypothetical protein